MSKGWKYPTVYDLKGLMRMVRSSSAEVGAGVWAPARPMGYPSLLTRLRAAWLAFTGECDLVRWPGNQ